MKKIKTETFEVKSEELLKKVKHLVKMGNTHRIIIRDSKGKTFVEIPFTVGLIGTLLIPLWVTIGAITALAARFTIVVERRED